MITPNYTTCFPYDGYCNDIIWWVMEMGQNQFISRNPIPRMPHMSLHIFVEKSLPDRNYHCRVQVHLRHYYIICTYCCCSDDGGIRARMLLSIAVWPAGSAGGSLASFFVKTTITIEIEMWPSHDGFRCRGWPTDQNVKNT